MDNNLLKELVLQRLKQIRIDPILGQHFLVDQSVLNLLVKNVTTGNVVIEVGSGVGQMTEAIEIDKKFRPILNEISNNHRNIEVIYENTLSLDWKALIRKYRDKAKIQIVSNLPYHISEPFLHKIAGLGIQDAVLLVGKKLGFVVQAQSGDDPNFGLRSLLVQTFFKIGLLAPVAKQSFLPIPRTDALLVKLTPRSVEEIKANKHDFIFRRLFLTSRHSPLVKNCIKEALIELDNKTLTQNQAKEIISSLDLPETVLNKPFEQLRNKDLRLISGSLHLIR